jgi:hypothetical protein
MHVGFETIMSRLDIVRTVSVSAPFRDIPLASP